MGNPNDEHPKVFISYCHESQEYLDKVLELSDRLREDGIDCHIDQYETAPPEGWPKWMEKQIKDAQFVFVVCTEEYNNAFQGKDKGKRKGVKAESSIITRELYNAEYMNRKFIPLLFSPDDEKHIPDCLDGYMYFVTTKENGYEDLYRLLTKQPRVIKPPLGEIRDLSKEMLKRKELPERERKTEFSVEPAQEVPKQKIATPKKESKPEDHIKVEIPQKKIKTFGLSKEDLDEILGHAKSRKTIKIDLPDLPENAKLLEMVHIPAGTFMMGSPAHEQDRLDWEWIEHQVTITKDFYLGKYEVTQAQWEAVMGSQPSNSYGLGPNYPVYYVSWQDAVKFCNKLSQVEGRTPVYQESGNYTANLNADGYRLPTEAEWEYACRAGTQTRFYWGDDPSYTDIKDYCWYDGNNSPSGSKEVGQKIPNAFGLYDMSGNLWEWCHDWWQDPFTRNAVADPVGPDSGSGRVIRGGGWGYGARGCRSAYRRNYSPGGRGRFGFRLLRSYP